MLHNINSKLLSNRTINDKYTSLLLAVLLLYAPILTALNSITNLYFPNTPIDTGIILTAILLFSGLAIPTILYRAIIPITISTVIFLLFCILSYIIYPINIVQINDYFPFKFITVFPFVYIGFALRNYDKLFTYLQVLAPFSIIAGIVDFAIRILSGHTLLDNMSLAYMLLPSVIITIYFAFKSKRLLNIALSVLGIMLLFATGTRGPIFSVVIYFIFLITLSTKKIIRKPFIIMAFIVFVYLSLSNNAIINLLGFMSSMFTKIGLSARSIDFILTNNFFASSDRTYLYNIVFESITQRPLIGFGLFGDRSILQYLIVDGQSTGLYVHNILLEFLSSFGILLGSILLIILFYILFKSFIKNRHNYIGALILILIPISIVKLMYSSSFLEEPMFFLLVGVSLISIRNNVYRINC